MAAFKGKTLITHYGQGFDFQLLYEDMYSYGLVIQGNLNAPIMKGNKIMKGKLYNDITLVDSFNYIMSGLAEMPKMFAFKELAKGIFHTSSIYHSFKSMQVVYQQWSNFQSAVRKKKVFEMLF